MLEAARTARVTEPNNSVVDVTMAVTDAINRIDALKTKLWHVVNYAANDSVVTRAASKLIDAEFETIQTLQSLGYVRLSRRSGRSAKNTAITEIFLDFLAPEAPVQFGQRAPSRGPSEPCCYTRLPLRVKEGTTRIHERAPDLFQPEGAETNTYLRSKPVV